MNDTVWKNKDFIWLISGQTVSTFGSAITSFALPWLILDITGSALQMGLIAAAGFLPYLFFSLPAGVWADRQNRKKLLLISNIGKMFLILIIPSVFLFLHIETIGLVYVIRIGLSFFDAIFDASYGAILPSIVSKVQLKQANSVMQTGVAASTIMGPTIGGLLVTQFGAAPTLFFDGFSYIVAILSLLFIVKDFSVKKRSPQQQNMKEDILEGLKFILRQPTIRTLSLLAMFSNISNAALLVVIVYRLKTELHIPAGLTGMVLSGISIGALVASLLSTFIGKHFSMKKVMYSALFVQILPPLIILFGPNPFIMTIGTILMGSAGVLWNINAISLQQTIIPNDMLGRVNSGIKMAATACIPLGSSVGGALAQSFGTAVVFIAAASIRATNFLLALKLTIKDDEIEEEGLVEKTSS